MKMYVFFFIVFFLFISLSLQAQTNPQPGDVNADGQINILDALITAQYSVGLQPAVFHAAAADVNGSGSADIIDALLIAQYSVGLINGFPVSGGDVEVLMSSLQRNPVPAPAAGELEAVADGNNEFAFDCYRQLKNSEGNVFFSPVSLSFAFAMCYAGANGRTETEIANTLHFTLPEDRLHNAFNALDDTLTGLLTVPSPTPNPMYGENPVFHIANSSWGQKGYAFMPQFLDILAYNYGAGMNLVDFMADPEKSRLLINDWVSEKTEQRINDLLPRGAVNTYTRLVLTNAIYFKANWLFPFKPADTSGGSFHLPNGTARTVSMMHEVTELAYKEVPGQYQVVRLPYQGSKHNYMLIVLPAEGWFEAVENSLTPDAYSGFQQGMSVYQVTLALPKFGFEWSASLKPALQAMGMNDAFADSTADFSGINGIPHDLYIFDVLHKSFISVDEKGTEASAATAIVVSTPSIPPAATMTINRPFLFFICNGNTGAILFFGRVLQP